MVAKLGLGLQRRLASRASQWWGDHRRNGCGSRVAAVGAKLGAVMKVSMAVGALHGRALPLSFENMVFWKRGYYPAETDSRPAKQSNLRGKPLCPTIAPTMKAPELLLPAGSLDKMRAAYDFGADAIYAGQPRYSLRARNNDFRLEQIAQGIQEAHQRGKKFFVTSKMKICRTVLIK